MGGYSVLMGYLDLVRVCKGSKVLMGFYDTVRVL